MNSNEEYENVVAQIVNRNGLKPHPEGGFFKETYRSTTKVAVELPDGSLNVRTASTAIMFLISNTNVSRLHRIKSDEIWHFYGGSALIVVELDTETLELKSTLIGADFLNGESVQYTVPAGKWFGCYTDGPYSLVGCTVAPGFEFEDFELASSAHLRGIFRDNTEALLVIDKLCSGL